MELSRIPDIGPVHAQILAEAGVRTAAELAVLADLAGLAERTKVHRSTLEAFQTLARAHVETLLEASGIRSARDLAEADLDALSVATAVPRAHLEAFQRAARVKLGDAAGAPAPADALPDRIILSEGRATARVSLGGAEHGGLAIVTLRMEEDETRVLERVEGDAVVLKEGCATAPARVDGVLHRDLPIYKARAAEGDPERREEIRVRVTRIKDRKDAPPQATPAGPPGAADAAADASAPGPAKKKGFSLFRRGR